MIKSPIDGWILGDPGQPHFLLGGNLTIHRSIALFVAALFGSTLGALKPSIAEHIKIVALGASNIAGPYVRDEEKYPAQLQAALRADGYDVTVENAGVSGDTTEFIRKRAPEATQGAQIVIFDPCCNDAIGDRRQNFRSLAHEETEANIDATVRDLRARGIQVLMYQYSENGAGPGMSYNARSVAIAKTYGAVFLGPFTFAIPASEKFSDTYGHLRPEGYAEVVHRLVPVVEAAINQLKH